MNFTRNTFRAASLLAVLPALMIGATAQAEGGGITLGLDYGKAEARKFCDNLSNCDSADNSARAEVGLQFNDMFGVEFGYTSLGTLLDSRDNAFQAHQDSSALTLSAIGLFPLSDQFGIYGRLGLAEYETDSSGTVAGIPLADQDGNEIFYGVGLKLALSDSLALRGEYQVYTDISRVDGRKADVDAMYIGLLFSL